MSSGAKQKTNPWYLLALALTTLLTLSTPLGAERRPDASGASDPPESVDEREAGDGALAPAFTPIPELTSGFEFLYTQKFPEAREKFSAWESQHGQEPFGEVAVAASYLFEEFYRQGVLTSDFFLNEKKFLNGIDGKPNAELMSKFQGALARTRTLAHQRLKENPKDSEALFALTLAAGMESDADMILRKERLEALKLLDIPTLTGQA